MKDGREMEQKMQMPADGDGVNTPTVEQQIMQMLMQYANVGMLKKDRANRKFILVTCGMIDTVECDEPSIILG